MKLTVPYHLLQVCLIRFINILRVNADDGESLHIFDWSLSITYYRTCVVTKLLRETLTNMIYTKTSPLVG